MADITGTGGPDTLAGTDGDDTIAGLGGDDILDAGPAGTDTLYGNDGNDRLVAHAGTATLYGDDGDDLITVAPDLSGNLLSSIRAVADGGDGYNTLELSYVMTASAYYQGGRWTYSSVNADLHRGVRIVDFRGVERLVADSGSRIDFGAVTDGWTIEAKGLSLIATGSGDDTIIGSPVEDVIDPGDGINHVVAGDGFDRITLAPDGGGSVDGGGDIDTLLTAMSVDLAGGTAGGYTITGIENVTLTAMTGAFDVTGNDAANEITVTYGSEAGVVLAGGGGDDLLSSGLGAAVLDGGNGDDRLEGSAGDDRLVGGSGDDVLSGSSGDDVIDGGDGDDRIGGDVGDDIVDGGGGTDRLVYADPSFVFGYPAYRTDFWIAGAADGARQVSDRKGVFGADTVRGVEEMVFRDGILTSDPNGRAAILTRLYDTALDRAPDAFGLFSWLDALDGGVAIAAVARDIVASSEFTGLGTLSDGAFVDLLFRNAVDRAPTADERGRWTSALQAGESRGGVLLAISESSEHRTDTADTIARGIFETTATSRMVAQLYDTFAERLPDREGFTGWTTAAAFSPGETIAAGFAGSPEFQDAIAGMTNAQVVTYLYNNSFDRSPEPDGLSFWTGLLDGGTPLATVVFDIATSLEHRIDLAPSYASGISFT